MNPPEKDISNVSNDTDKVAIKDSSRLQFVETNFAVWCSIALAVSLLGVLIHINLDSYVGVVMLFLGLTFAIVIVLAGVFYMWKPKMSDRHFFRMRQYVLFVQYVLVIGCIASGIYTGTIMIRRSENMPL